MLQVSLKQHSANIPISYFDEIRKKKILICVINITAVKENYLIPIIS